MATWTNPNSGQRSQEVTIKGNERFSGWSQWLVTQRQPRPCENPRGALCAFLSPAGLASRRPIPPEVSNFQYETLGWGAGWHRAFLCCCLERPVSDAPILLDMDVLQSRDRHRQAR